MAGFRISKEFSWLLTRLSSRRPKRPRSLRPGMTM
nr:MAG TPA: hypothetical protein [Caudoviricetes sp.]